MRNQSDMRGVLCELREWFRHGSQVQRELLVTSLRQACGIISEEMPDLEEVTTEYNLAMADVAIPFVFSHHDPMTLQRVLGARAHSMAYHRAIGATVLDEVWEPFMSMSADDLWNVMDQIAKEAVRFATEVTIRVQENNNSVTGE